MWFGLGVRVALTLVTIIVSLRRYGILATLTGKRMKHAAIGRAKRVKGHVDLHYGARVTDHFVRDIVANLRAERLLVLMMARQMYVQSIRTA